MDRISAIRSILADCSISTDMIAGFCTETEEDHNDSLSLMEWAGFDFAYIKDGIEAKSLFILAFPAPQVRYTFEFDDHLHQVTLPPTYHHYRRNNDLAGSALAKLIQPLGYQIWKTCLPLKTLAVRSGLAKYGRNNISYVPGLGSFHQLAAFFSDLPCD